MMSNDTRSGARRWWALGMLVTSLSLAGCYRGGPQLADDEGDDGGMDDAGMDDADLVGPETCVDTTKFYKEQAWTVLSQNCAGCHNPSGEAANTDLVLQMADYPGYHEVNQQTVENISRLQIDGMPLLLAKPSGQVIHGGGLRIEEGSDEYLLLEQMIEHFGAPVHCDNDSDIDRFYDGVQTLDEEETLRKAVFLLASRMPTGEELDAVRGQGIDAVDSVLDTVLQEEAFYVRIKEIFNDLIHTDAYRIGDDAVETVDEGTFPNAFWFDDIEDNDQRNLMRRRTNDAIAREPLEIVEHVLRTGVPFTEAFTANYTIINPFSARSYGIDLGLFADANDENERITYSFENLETPIPQAGILTTSVFLNRYPTTATNRNRARSRFFFKFFLATDVMRLAARSIDATAINDHNPTMDNAQCTSCHSFMDPVAGAFMNWDDMGRYRPMDGWFTDMRAPGFGEIQVPYEEYPQALRWLTSELVKDPKFSLAMVHLVYTGLTGQDPLQEPMELEDADYLARIRAFEAQDHTFKKIAEGFVTAGYDLRYVIKEVVKSTYFRASNTETALDEQRYMELADMGTARILSPEALHRKLIATTGVEWVKNGTNPLLSGDYYKFFYGGIDSVSVTDRLTEMNGVMANVADRMSNEMACTVTAFDFTKPAEERLLFPEVEITDLPSGGEAAIRANLVHLHQHLLGETLEADSPEIDRSFAVFNDVWEDGQAGLMIEPGPETQPYPVSLPGLCRATEDPTTGDAIPAELQVVEDPDYTVRSWMAVMSYMLGDYRYLYE